MIKELKLANDIKNCENQYFNHEIFNYLLFISNTDLKIEMIIEINKFNGFKNQKYKKLTLKYLNCEIKEILKFNDY